MNVLEHYIIEVHVVKDITALYESKTCEQAKEPLLEVTMLIDCYGSKSDVRKHFYKSEWERVKEQGYYMA